MIDYESYKEIMNYLKDNKIEELKFYLEKEKNLDYLRVASECIKDYLQSYRRETFYGYLDNDNILISNSISVYQLYSDEILSKYYRKKLKHSYEYRERVLFGKDRLDESFKESSYKVDEIDKNDDKIELFNKEKNIIHTFSTYNFEYLKKFLGGDIEYKILDSRMPVCIAESEKGKGLILGVKNGK